MILTLFYSARINGLNFDFCTLTLSFLVVQVSGVGI